MPTKRQFDLVILCILLANPVRGLFKMVATRRSADDNAGPVDRIASGALRIVS